MTIKARMIETGLAVALGIYICNFFSSGLILRI